MKRNEFLSTFGISASTILFAPFLVSCGKNSAALGSGGGSVDFTLDLTQPANSALNTNGGFVYNGGNGVIVARTSTGSYIAVSFTCTHQGSTVVYEGGSNLFYCQTHGSEFSSNGSVLRGPAAAPLTQYKTQLTGTSLRVYA